MIQKSISPALRLSIVYECPLLNRQHFLNWCMSMNEGVKWLKGGPKGQNTQNIKKLV